MALFDLAVINWAVALYAPLYAYDSCYGCTPRLGRFSLVDAEGGLGQFVRDNPVVVRFILAFLILAGVATMGTYLHAGRRASSGRWLVWGGGVLLLFVVTAMTALPDQSAFAGNFQAYIDSQFGATPSRAFPYLDVLNIAPIAFPDLVHLIVGPGVCAALAVIAAVTAGIADARAQT